MWCKNCNMRTRDSVCPVCGQPTYEDVPAEVCWCKACRIPIIREADLTDRPRCPNCGGETQFLAVDLRPVFSEERLLLEILLDKPVNALSGASVWAAANRYYIDGGAVTLSMRTLSEADADRLTGELRRRQPYLNKGNFDRTVDSFVAANRHRLNAMTQEALEFVRETVAPYPRENVVISFSGGKDSTVTADIVPKALSDPSIVHIFGDTTLEFPSTVEYAGRYREAHISFSPFCFMDFFP